MSKAFQLRSPAPCNLSNCYVTEIHCCRPISCALTPNDVSGQSSTHECLDDFYNILNFLKKRLCEIFGAHVVLRTFHASVHFRDQTSGCIRYFRNINFFKTMLLVNWFDYCTLQNGCLGDLRELVQFSAL